MHLESTILIESPPDRVWRFLADVANIPKWDRGVAAVAPHTPVVAGATFDTFADPDAPDDARRNGRMSYRVAEVDPDRHQCRVDLTSRDGNARYFKAASWTFRGAEAQGGTLVTCAVDFVLHTRWMVLAPVFYLLRGAIARDLRHLKKVLEAEQRPRPS